MPSPTLEVLLRLQQALFNRDLKTAQASLRSFGDSATRIGQSAGVAFLGLAGVVATSAKAFSDFEKGMSNVSTLVDTNTESIQAMGKEVLAISQRTPVAIGDLTSALYDVRSAGIDAGRAMGVLEQSARLSVAGLSTAKEATKLVTGSLNTFQSENLTAAQVSDLLFATVKSGVATIASLSQSFGATAPTIEIAGVKLKDFLAATAALTTSTTPASVAQTQLRAAIVSLLNPTKEMSEIFKKLGVESGPELIKVSGGMGEAFKKIYETAAASGVNLNKAASSVEAFSAIVSLSTSRGATYNSTLKDMEKNAGAVDEAFAKQNATFSATVQKTINSLQILGIEIGSGLVPALTFLAETVQKVTAWFSSLPEPMKQFIATGLLVATVITGIVAGATLLIGSIAGAVAAILGAGEGIGVVAGILLALGGTIATLAVIWQTNFLKIQDVVRAAVQTILTIQYTIEGIAPFVEIVFKAIAAYITRSFEIISLAASTAVTAIQGQFKKIYTAASTVFRGVLTAAEYLFNSIIGATPPLLKSIASTILGWAKNMVIGLNPIFGVINAIYQAVGKPKIDFSGVFKGIKPWVDASVSYVKLQWKDAGATIDKSIDDTKKAAQDFQKLYAQISKGVNTAHGAVPGVGGGGGDKKSGTKEKKAQTDALKAVTEALTHALKANELAADEATVNLGAYASESQKAAVQVAKLEKDEAALLATRARLGALRFKGDAEKERLDALQKIGEQIRENGAEQIRLQNQLSKLKIESNLSQSLEANQDALDNQIRSLSQYASEGVKLSKVIEKLKADEAALGKARADIVAAGGKGDALTDIDQQIKDATKKRKDAEKDFTSFSEQQARARLNAENELTLTKLKIQNDASKQQADFEIKQLDAQLSKKLISQKDYNAQVAAIEDEQAGNQIRALDTQKTILAAKRAEMETINGVTAESLALYGQELELQAQIAAIEQERANAKTLALENLTNQIQQTALQLVDVASQALENFNGTLITGLIQGNLNLKDAMTKLWQQIAIDAEKLLFKKLSDGFFDLLKKMVAQNATSAAAMVKPYQTFGSAVSAIFKGIFSILDSIFAGGLTLIVNFFKRFFNVAKGANIGAAQTKVQEWAINAAAAVAGIPIIGPALAIKEFTIAQALGNAAVARMQAVQASFAVGTPAVPGDMLANIHEGEMIVPKTFAQAIRSGELSLSGGQNAGGGGGSTIHISFEGANFNGVPREWVDQIESLLIEKKNTVGSALFAT